MIWKINKTEDNNHIETYKLLSSKLSSVNNRVRFSILEILSDVEKTNILNNSSKKEPLYSREINSILLNNYDIKITPQMLGQHLKQLEDAGLVQELFIKKEIPNKVGFRMVKGYKINPAAFKDLFLDIDIFRQELLSLFKLYEHHKMLEDKQHLVLTILNGPDEGKTFKISQKETIFVGRISNYSLTDIISFSIPLNNSYFTVSSISKPHVKIFYHEDKWYILDENSFYGTYLDEKLIPQHKIVNLRNNSFLRLSRGDGGVVFYCSYIE